MTVADLGLDPPLDPPPGRALNRVYFGLPEHYRVADADLGYPLLRWLAGSAAELSTVLDLIDGIDFRGIDEGGPVDDTSTLTDPTVAPDAWLPWLAQLVGVQLAPSLSPMERRAAVSSAASGWRAGTKTSVAAAAATALTGTRYARVLDHSIFDEGDGGEWDVLIITRATETASSAEVLATIARRGAKPAGVVLHHRAYGTSWDNVTAAYPTWDALEAAGSWDRIQEAGLA